MKKEVKIERFKPEKRAKYQPPKGAWESALLVARDLFQMSSNDYDFWVQIEEKAEFSKEEGVFHYWMAGIGHMTLAKRMVSSLPHVVASAAVSREGAAQKDQLEELLTKELFDLYPDKYKKIISKK